MNSNTLSIAAFLGGVVALAYLLFSHGLVAGDPVAGVFQILGVMIMIWARVTFGRRSFHAGASPTEGGLVTSGPYRHIRHPIYSSLMLIVVAGILSNWSLGHALAGCVFIVLFFVRLILEEQQVVLRYPEYAVYAGVTKRLIPYLY